MPAAGGFWLAKFGRICQKLGTKRPKILIETAGLHSRRRKISLEHPTAFRYTSAPFLPRLSSRFRKSKSGVLRFIQFNHSLNLLIEFIFLAIAGKGLP
jgi:hypothetical protein